MKILVIDNAIDPHSVGSQALRDALHLKPGVHLVTRRGPEDDFPEAFDGFDGWVISGSRTSCLATAPWIEKLDQLIREAEILGFPTLGVCYGHQSIARALHGRQRVRTAKVPEFGWTKIERLGPSKLKGDLPESFISFSSHREEVVEAPEDFRVTARSEDCAIQAFEHEHKPIFGIQFHPEKRLQEAEDLRKALERSGQLSLYRGLGQDSKLHQPEVAAKIFGSFLEIVKHHRRR